MKKFKNANELSDVWVSFSTHGYRKHLRFGQYIANNYDVGDLEVFYVKEDSLAFNLIWDWILENP